MASLSSPVEAEELMAGWDQGVITILSGWRAFTLEKIFFWPKLKGSCVEMKKNTNRQPPP